METRGKKKKRIRENCQWNRKPFYGAGIRLPPSIFHPIKKETRGCFSSCLLPRHAYNCSHPRHEYSLYLCKTSSAHTPYACTDVWRSHALTPACTDTHLYWCRRTLTPVRTDARMNLPTDPPIDARPGMAYARIHEKEFVKRYHHCTMVQNS